MKIFDSIPTEEPISEILNRINEPEDLRNLQQSQIPQLADELREFLLYTVGKTGGLQFYRLYKEEILLVHLPIEVFGIVEDFLDLQAH